MSFLDLVKEALESSSDEKAIKIILIDSDGNVISDIKLSDLRDALRGTDNRTLTDLFNKAYDSTNDREKISIENDAVGLAKETTLSSIDGKITKVDTDNVKVISEVAYDSTNDRKKVSIENDAVGLLKEGGNVNVANFPSDFPDSGTQSRLDDLKGALESVGTDKLQTTIVDSKIQVPVDLQSILPKKAELYDADETVDQEISLDIGGFKLVEVVCKATAATTFTVEYSFDNTHWFTYYTSSSAETEYNDVFWTAARYIRVKSAGAGASGDTVSLVIGAKP